MTIQAKYAKHIPTHLHAHVERALERGGTLRMSQGTVCFTDEYGECIHYYRAKSARYADEGGILGARWFLGGGCCCATLEDVKDAINLKQAVKLLQQQRDQNAANACWPGEA